MVHPASTHRKEAISPAIPALTPHTFPSSMQATRTATRSSGRPKHPCPCRCARRARRSHSTAAIPSPPCFSITGGGARCGVKGWGEFGGDSLGGRGAPGEECGREECRCEPLLLNRSSYHDPPHPPLPPRSHLRESVNHPFQAHPQKTPFLKDGQDRAASLAVLVSLFSPSWQDRALCRSIVDGCVRHTTSLSIRIVSQRVSWELDYRSSSMARLLPTHQSSELEQILSVETPDLYWWSPEPESGDHQYKSGGLKKAICSYSEGSWTVIDQSPCTSTMWFEEAGTVPPASNDG